MFRPVRLAALRDHPEAFGSSVEEEQAAALGADMARLIAPPPGVTLGGFVGGALVATACLVVSPRVKQRHKGHLSAVYVAPGWRGTGLARDLLAAIIEHGRQADLVTLTLAVTVGNQPARQLYQRAGFQPYGIEPASLRVGAAFFDEELMVLRLR